MPAHRAEAVPVVPVNLRPSLGENACLGRAQHFRSGAGVLKSVFPIFFNLFADLGFLREVNGEMGDFSLQPQKQGVPIESGLSQRGQVKPAQFRLGSIRYQNPGIPKGQEFAGWVPGLTANPLCVPTLPFSPVE